MRAAAFGTLMVFSVAAQDAGMVLRTSVGYNTAARTMKLEPETRERVDALAKEATRASAAGQHGEAMKSLHKGMALMRGAEWTPTLSLAASLIPSVDHTVWEPGQKITLSFKRLYASDEGAPQSLPAKLIARPTSGAPTPVADLTSAGGAFVVPTSLAAGVYRLEIALPVPKTIDVIVAPGAAARSKALQQRLAKLTSNASAAKTSAEYLASLYSRADRGEIRPDMIDFGRELTLAEDLVSALENGREPLKSRAGDLHLAYVSKVDQTAQPYRVYAPKGYKEPVPLVVVLHGMGGDENVILGRPGTQVRTIQDLADKYGWILAAPKGREPTSMYRGAAEQDVLDVIAEVRKLYRIDDRRIYAFGISMGGYGVWSIAQNNPDLFAALAPVAGGGNPARMEAIKSIPQIVVHGDNDATVLVSQSRAMVEAARKLGTEVKYIEVPGGTHDSVIMPNLSAIFEFFSAQVKGQ
jgi:acetyl esterase/lipase